MIKKMTSKELATVLEIVPWHFAKTMPECPHEYTLKREWPSSLDFAAVVVAIRRLGKPRRWKGRTFIYFDAGVYMYWTMGDSIQNTILINRAIL